MRRNLFAGVLAATLVAGVPVAASAQQRGIDVTTYRFLIDLPDTGNVIKGMATVLFNRTRGYDDTLRLDLVGMTVDRVFDIQSIEQLPFTHDGAVLKILARRVPGVVIQYHGAPSDGLVYRPSNARGHRSFFADNWPSRARFWLPTNDHPSDKARVMFSVRAPAGMRVVMNARDCLSSRRPVPGSSVPGSSVSGCYESGPIPTYTMVIGATTQTVSQHRDAVVGRDLTPIEVWAYPEDSAFADDGPFRRATEIVETLSRIVGPFPYSRLAHVESSTRYGGMENATAIFYDENAYVRRTMREGVVRHETAHQWFGDAVTEADWHHVWLSEGFATYFDLVAGAALDGDSVLRAGLRANARTYMTSKDTARPVIDTVVTDPMELLNRNSYQKGGWVLHMLRGVMGDSAFFQGIRDYYHTYRDSSVLTAQFRRRMEVAAHADLGWFFRQWLTQPGYPQLDVTWRHDEAAGAVVLNVRQAQPAEWGSYRLPVLPVALHMQDGQVLRRSMSLDERQPEQTFPFMINPAQGLVRDIVIDPDGTLLLAARVRRR